MWIYFIEILSSQNSSGDILNLSHSRHADVYYTIITPKYQGSEQLLCHHRSHISSHLLKATFIRCKSIIFRVGVHVFKMLYVTVFIYSERKTCGRFEKFLIPPPPRCPTPTHTPHLPPLLLLNLDPGCKLEPDV